MLTGHQHRKLSAVLNKTALVQPGYRGEALGKIVLEIDKQSKKIKSMSAELIDVSAYKPAAAINSVSLALDKKTQKWLDQPIAHLDNPAPVANANQARIDRKSVV